APEMHAPKIVATEIDWEAAVPNPGDLDSPMDRPDALARLNEKANPYYPNIAASPVPVLVPFDGAEMLRDRSAGHTDHMAFDYTSGFGMPTFFQAGPGGYDAAYLFHTHDIHELGIQFSERVIIQVSGSSLLYELDEPHGIVGLPARALEWDF